MERSPERAVITGISGQDGWYLARRLLELGQEVIGTTHRAGVSSLDVAGTKVPLIQVDLSDVKGMRALLREQRPTTVYNFASRASSAQLFDDPLATAEINGLAVGRWLEGIRSESPTTRFCQASSSEVFAGAESFPQDEMTRLVPLSAYGAAKAYADHLVSAYRSTHSLFACSAVLYSHESPRRPPHFLMRKVTRAAARIRRGLESQVLLGDLEASRDWGYAPDYVEAMRLMLVAETARDFVIATGELHTVREVCEVAFSHLGLDWRHHVEVDERFKRAVELVPRVGNAAHARVLLAWAPTCTFAEMVRVMVEADCAVLARELNAAQ